MASLFHKGVKFSEVLSTLFFFFFFITLKEGFWNVWYLFNLLNIMPYPSVQLWLTPVFVRNLFELIPLLLYILFTSCSNLIAKNQFQIMPDLCHLVFQSSDIFALLSNITCFIYFHSNSLCIFPQVKTKLSTLLVLKCICI